eukprot:EG_transcript_9136
MCHVSVEVCRRCSAPPATADGGGSGGSPTAIIAGAAAAGGAAVLLAAGVAAYFHRRSAGDPQQSAVVQPVPAWAAEDPAGDGNPVKPAPPPQVKSLMIDVTENRFSPYMVQDSVLIHDDDGPAARISPPPSPSTGSSVHHSSEL